MVNNKSKQTKKKSSLKKSSTSVTAGTRVQVPQRSVKIGHSMMERVCSITDPFCSAAVGSKWMDDAANKTMPYAARAIDVITSGATGTGALLIAPSFTYPISRPTDGSGGSASFVHVTTVIPFTFTPAQYRIVSWGITIKRITAPLYSSGVLRIRGLSNSGASLGNINSHLFNDYHYDIPLQDCQDVAIIGRRMNDTHHFFRKPSETNPDDLIVNWVPPGWAPLFIYLEGVPASTNVVQVEYFFNYELLWEDGDSMQLMTTPPPPANPVITAASTKVNQMVGNVFVKGVKQVEQAVTRYATQYLAGALGSLLGGPGGGLAAKTGSAMLMNSMEVN